MARPYRYISADSHLEIPPERWTNRVPAKHRDRAPRTIKIPMGEALMVEGRPLNVLGLNFGTRGWERLTIGGTYEETPGTGQPDQRVREQDQDGIDAEIMFTGVSGPNLWRGIRNDEAYCSVVRAFNEYLGEEYCPAFPDRLLGLGVIPEVGVDAAIAEMKKCKDLGLVGVTLNSFPSGKSFPTKDDDRFWAAAVDLDMPITIHVDFGFPSGTYGGRGKMFEYERAPEDGENDVILRFGKYGFRGSIHAVQLLWFGVFDRFPTFKLYVAETQIGWLPNFFEQMDNHYQRHYRWANKLLGLKPLDRMPSEYIKEHVYWGFLWNPVGVRAVHREGPVNRVMWASDMPHGETDWPNSLKSMEENFRGIPEEEVQQMVKGNCLEFFHLTDEVNLPELRTPAGTTA
jgi:predicted TIM-barrel fold metal-dependent hydrolase